jgi:hypothetical protein
VGAAAFFAADVGFVDFSGSPGSGITERVSEVRTDFQGPSALPRVQAENLNYDLVFDPHFETTSFLSDAARTEF